MNNILAIAFLIAGALLTIGTTTIVPAAYAGGDHDGGDGNKVKAEDDSIAQLNDCDDNENGDFSSFSCDIFVGEP